MTHVPSSCVVHLILLCVKAELCNGPSLGTKQIRTSSHKCAMRRDTEMTDCGRHSCRNQIVLTEVKLHAVTDTALSLTSPEENLSCLVVPQNAAMGAVDGGM